MAKHILKGSERKPLNGARSLGKAIPPSGSKLACYCGAAPKTRCTLGSLISIEPAADRCI